MKVNVVDKRGKVVGLHPKVAQVLVAKGTVRYAEDEPKAAPTYQTRALQAAPVQAEDPAPYDYKADGTPRKRPGRPAAVADDAAEEVDTAPSED